MDVRVEERERVSCSKLFMMLFLASSLVVIATGCAKEDESGKPGVAEFEKERQALASRDSSKRPKKAKKSARGAKGEKANITLTYSPINPEQLRGYQVTCGIVNGRKYVFSLDADGHKPSLKFSHHSHDFGACLVHQPGLPPRRHTLTVTNMDTKEYSIDCIFDSTEFPFLHVGDSPASLAPGQSADVDVEFFPDQPKHYKALVPFSVNGLYTVNVVYTGEGVPMRLELVKPEQNSVHFGHVREGHSETREIRMVNKSRLPVTCVVDKQCLFNCVQALDVCVFLDQGDE